MECMVIGEECERMWNHVDRLRDACEVVNSDAHGCGLHDACIR